MLTASQRVAALALVIAASTAATAFAQDTAANPDGPETMGTETMPEEGPGSALRQAQDAPTDQPGMIGDPMEQGMMDHGMTDGPMDEGMTSPGATGQGMMCSQMCGGMGGQGGMGAGMMGQGGMGGMMHSGMMNPGGMGGDTAEDRTPPGMMGSMAGMGMHGHAMRIVFAIADANDDGGLSLEEIADIQARIFSAMDADNDDNVTPEELQAFMQE